MRTHTNENCVLRDAFTGRQILRLTRAEADSMVREGTAKRTGAHRYIHVKPIPPSDADESSPMLTVGDTRIVAGLVKPTVEQAERLQGWGFRVRTPRVEVRI